MIVTDTLFSKLLKSFVAFCAIATLGIAASTPAFADQTSKSLDVNLTLGNSISVRILDSTATSDLSLLSFDLTPTAAGVTSTKRAIVDVSTSNITGYKLYVEANGKDHSNNYTTDLVQGDTADSHVIPTSTSTASNKNFWNYVNPATSTATVVPAHGNPDQIGYLLEPTTSTKSNVDINVGVDTTITAGSYTNQLLFTAIANAESIDYTLYFDKNAPSGVDPSDIENFPVNQTASASATSYTFTIPDTAPTLAGYTFGGYVDPTATPGSKGSSADPYLPGDDVTVVADPTASVIAGTKTLNAQWTIVSSTLTVDPNGGTWSGSTSTQTFPGDYGSTKVIGTPSANATYTISYNDNSQSATYSPNPPAPTSGSRPFTGWTLTATGGGSPSGSFDTTTNTYTYNIASDTLTAGYNTTSNAFTLPTVTKTGHTCTWHEGSASGTSHASGETGVTITSNTEFFAVCAANSHNVTVAAGANIASTTGSGSHNYGSTVNIGATASTGYHFSSWTVNSGGVTVTNNQFTMPDNDVSVTANATINACTIHYNVNTPSDTTSSGSTADSNFNYNTVTATTANGFTATGYNWAGWAESAGGTAVITTSGGSITAAQAANWCGTHGATKQLYAKWTKKYTYTLNLNKNDGTTDKQILNYPSSGGTTDASHQFTSLNTYAPSRAGYKFLGWATSSTGTSYVTSYTLNSSSASSTPTSEGFPVTGNLYAIWEKDGCPAGANRICYMSNEPSGAGTVSGTMDDQVEVYLTSNSTSVDHTALSGSTAELTLYSPNWTLTNYGFAGWNTAADGSGLDFGPNETINLATDHPDLQTQLGTGGIKLYAQWIQQNGTMDTFSCSSLTNIGDVTARTYGSDTYAIAKLKDGKCWMIENLRTSTNAGTDKGTSWTATVTDRQYNLANITGSNPSPTNTGSTAIQWKSYGGYYSWASAIGNASPHNTGYGNPDSATGSAQGICPDGWRLPRAYFDNSTSGANADFTNLTTQLTGSGVTLSKNLRKYPNNFVFAGYWSSSSSYNRGTRGLYWSSTVYNSNGAYSLYFSSASVYPAFNLSKYYGCSVRCVAGS